MSVDPKMKMQFERRKSLIKLLHCGTFIDERASGKGFECFYHEKMTSGAGAMLQSCRALIALLEDQGGIPSTHLGGHNSLSESNVLFWPPWITGLNMVYIYTCRQKHP